jgi:uncharacterized protein (TIGR00304 family)
MESQMDASTTLYLFGTILVLIGALILILATVLMATLRKQKGQTKSAGVIIIGPIPIIFGTDKKSIKTILILSIILLAFLLTFSLVYHFWLR